MQARGTGIETPMLQVVVFNFTFDTIFSSIGFPIRPVLAKAPGLDGRAVQGARLKFESLRRRGFESHSKQFNFFFFPGCEVSEMGSNRSLGSRGVGHWSSGMILL